MARTRNIKPGFFKNEELAELGFPAMLLFAGLWTLADRDGRLEDRPKRIKAEIFPYNKVDIEDLLAKLDAHQFIKRYEVEGERYIAVPKWLQHQHPNKKESSSTIPAPNGHRASTVRAPHEHQTSRASIPLYLKPCTLEPDELARALSDRHRKKGDRGLIGAILVDIIAPLPDEQQKETLAIINARHEDWCKYDWAERDVKFIPKLSNWLREGGWRDDPEGISESPDDPGPGVPHASEIGPD